VVKEWMPPTLTTINCVNELRAQTGTGKL